MDLRPLVKAACSRQIKFTNVDMVEKAACGADLKQPERTACSLQPSITNHNMMNYRDMTFCTGAGCSKFNMCPRALTERVLMEATKWWGGPNAPVARFDDPTQLECYAGPKQKVFLRE